MANTAYSFLSVSDTEAKLVIVDRQGNRRENTIDLATAKRIVEKMKAKGLSGELPRSTKPVVNVRELVANLN
jgi:hypothetical protein